MKGILSIKTLFFKVIVYLHAPLMIDAFTAFSFLPFPSFPSRQLEQKFVLFVR